MVSDSERQAIADEEHLKLLRLGFLVAAGESALFSLFGLFYMGMGALVSTMAKQVPKHPGQPPPPEAVFWVFGALGAGIFLVFLTMAVLKLHVAKCIRLRESRTFCLVISLLTAPGFPYGTLLGVGAFVVLTRPSVKALFSGMGAEPHAMMTA